MFDTPRRGRSAPVDPGSANPGLFLLNPSSPLSPSSHTALARGAIRCDCSPTAPGGNMFARD